MAPYSDDRANDDVEESHHKGVNKADLIELLLLFGWAIVGMLATYFFVGPSTIDPS